MIKNRNLCEERLGVTMENMILFANSFLSYLLLMAVIVVLAGIAIFIGIKLRKNKNAKEAETEQITETES